MRAELLIYSLWTNRWVKPTCRNATDCNNRLAAFKKGIDDIIATFPNERNITVPILRSILNGSYKEEMEEGKGKTSFVDHVLVYNEGQYKAERIGWSVWNNTRCNMRNFQRFLKECGYESKGKRLMCRDVSTKLIADYITWRKMRGNSNETINKALTPIFKAVADCCSKGWIRRELCDEVCGMYLPKTVDLTARPDEEVQYLTKEEVRRLMDVAEKSKYPRTRELLDLFLFSVHTCGLRFSDIVTLRWDNIDFGKRMLRKYLIKGHTRKNTLLTIPLPDASIGILNRWKGRHKEFVFGMLPDGFDLTDAQELHRILNAKNRSVNTSLKTLGDKAGLKFGLHFHAARHTWATLSLNEGIDVKVISSLMGHSSVLVTEKVYSQFMPETLQATMDQRLNFAF